ncbi:MAG: flagellar export chaperone FliS [Pseudomonadota bacterium]|nr:flagellar export chaperone FliS [Pseudomonadota bacterium]MDE3037461.1 flagellar export chaperone FliS [Pseudomonadota bacterium]
MSHKYKYQAYAAATQTVARTKQIVLLYDGVIRLVQQAREAIHGQRIEDRFQLLTRASDIITGLQCCLDFDKGGDVARTLHHFYIDINARIFSVHRSNSLDTCNEIVAELKQMRDTWQEIDENSARGDAAKMPPGSPAAADSDQSIILSA